MDLRLVDLADETKVIPSGRFTFSSYPSFNRVLGRIADRPGSRMMIDMAGVTFIDSAALGMLLLAREKAERNNVTLMIRGATGSVLTLLKGARFHQIFEMEFA